MYVCLFILYAFLPYLEIREEEKKRIRRRISAKNFYCYHSEY